MLWRRCILGVLIALNIFLLYWFLWSEQGIFQYRDLQHKYQTLESRIQELDQQNLRLSQEIRMLQNDREHIEKMIRQQMNYVKENEILYLPENPSNVSQGATTDGQQN